jgi:acetyl esterase
VTLDPNAQRYLDDVAASGAPSVDHMTVREARESIAATADQLFGRKDAVAIVEDFAIPSAAGSIPARLYRSRKDQANGVLIYFHGGGWVFGSVDTHDGVCRALARRAGCDVVSVDYRLAPENKFPGAVEDAWTSLNWAFEHYERVGIRDPRVAVGGDSSGGNLAAVVALQARDARLPLCLQLLVYPVTDCHAGTPSYHEYASGYGLTRAEMQWFLDHYLTSAFDRENPKASPLLSPDVSQVAPALVITCEYDVLRDEGEAYADRLAAAGVPVQISRYDGLIHGFFRMGAIFTRCQDALDESAAGLRIAFESNTDVKSGRLRDN